MLGFKKKEKENIIQENLTNDQDLSYTELNWTEDLNNSHQIISDENNTFENLSFYQNDENIQDNSKFVNQSIFTDYQELNSDLNIFADTQKELEDNQINNKNIKVEKKKIHFSTRVKVHLTIYTLLVLFIFSMIIANSIMTNTAKSLQYSASSQTYTVQTNSLNKIELPDGTVIKINKQKNSSNKTINNTNAFDQFCDTLEGN